MEAKAEVLARVHELRHPLVLPEDRMQMATDHIVRGDYYAPVNKFDIYDPSQDVTPEAVLGKTERRYMLFVSDEGKGKVQIHHSDDDSQQEFDIENQQLIALQEALGRGYGNNYDKQLIKLYGVIELAEK